MKQEFIKTNIKDIYLVRPKSYIPSQLISYASYSKENFIENGLLFSIESEWNYLIKEKGLLQGLYVNTGGEKLLQVFSGAVYLVIADLRDKSAPKGRTCQVRLTSRNFWSIFLPKGVAYGLLSLEEDNLLNFKSSAEADSDPLIPFDDDKWKFLWPLKQLSISKVNLYQNYETDSNSKE